MTTDTYGKEYTRLLDLIEHLLHLIATGDESISIRKRSLKLNDYDEMEQRIPSNIPNLVGVGSDSEFSYIISFFTLSSGTNRRHTKGDGYIDISPRFVQVETGMSVRIPTCEIYDTYVTKLEQTTVAYETQKLKNILDTVTKLIGYERSYKIKNILEG